MTYRHRRRQIVRVMRKPGARHDGLLVLGQLTLRCQLGRSSVTHLKREGDGATPAAGMELVSLLYRADRLARPPGWFGRHAEAIQPGDGWCDDVGDGRYNRLVSLPVAASHERLWRDDGVYDVLGVLDWNIRPRSIGRGSAIFLHLARPDGGPTAGCIALSPHDMRLLPMRLRPGAVFQVV